jgi:hypothetical protein
MNLQQITKPQQESKTDYLKIKDAITITIGMLPEGNFLIVDYFLKALDKLNMYTMFSTEYYNDTLNKTITPASIRIDGISNSEYTSVILDLLLSTASFLELHHVDMRMLRSKAIKALTRNSESNIIKKILNYILRKNDTETYNVDHILTIMEVDVHSLRKNDIAVLLYIYKLYMKTARSCLDLEIEKISKLIK